jgi:hypothetical protein
MDEVKNIENCLDAIAKVLIRCFLMGVVVMLVWVGFLVLAGDFAYNVHSRFISLSREQFNCIQYAALAITKGCIFLYFLLPYIAIRLVLSKRQ